MRNQGVFNDCLLSIEIAQILSDTNIGTDKRLNMLKFHSEEILSGLFKISIHTVDCSNSAYEERNMSDIVIQCHKQIIR